MITLALVRVMQDQLRRGESSVGFCIVFVGLIWGTLVGGLLVAEPFEQLSVAVACALIAALLFARRELVLAHASLARAQS